MRGGPSGVVSVRDYGCAKVRRLLDSYLAGELTVETNHEILEHLAQCAACAGEAAAREELRAAVRRAAARHGAAPPAALEDRLRTLIARTPPPRRVPLPAGLLAAAALLGGIGLVVVSWRGFPRSGPGAGVTAPFDAGALPAAAKTQRACALRFDWRHGVPPLADLQKKVGAPYASALPVLAARLPGYTVVAAHKCAHGGREVVHLVFSRNGDAGADGVVSAIVMPRRGALPAERLAAVDHVRDERGASYAVASAREEGFDVAAVELPDADLFVVSSRGTAQNLELSRAILPAIVTALVR